MAFTKINGTVTTTATILFTVPQGLPYTAVQINNQHNQPIYIGADSTVTSNGATKGQKIGADTSVQIWLHSGDTVWAIASSASATGDVTIVYSGI